MYACNVSSNMLFRARCNVCKPQGRYYFYTNHQRCRFPNGPEIHFLIIPTGNKYSAILFPKPQTIYIPSMCNKFLYRSFSQEQTFKLAAMQ